MLRFIIPISCCLSTYYLTSLYSPSYPSQIQLIIAPNQNFLIKFLVIIQNTLFYFTDTSHTCVCLHLLIYRIRLCLYKTSPLFPSLMFLYFLPSDSLLPPECGGIPCNPSIWEVEAEESRVQINCTKWLILLSFRFLVCVLLAHTLTRVYMTMCLWGGQGKTLVSTITFRPVLQRLLCHWARTRLVASNPQQPCPHLPQCWG